MTKSILSFKYKRMISYLFKKMHLTSDFNQKPRDKNFYKKTLFRTYVPRSVFSCLASYLQTYAGKAS